MRIKTRDTLFKFMAISSIIIIAIVAILISISYRLNLNKHKLYLSQKFNEYTGRTLLLSGPVTINFFPAIHLQALNFSITNPDNFTSGNLIHANSLNATISWLALLKGSCKINDLTIDGLQVNLIKIESLDNWEFKSAEGTANNKDITPQLVLNKLTLTKFSLSYNNNGKIWQSSPVTLNINQDHGAINLFSQKIEADQANININNELKAEIDGTIHSSPKLSYSATLVVARFYINKVLQFAGIKPSAAYKKAFASSIAIKASFKGDQNSFELKKLNIMVNKTLIYGTAALSFGSLYKFTQNLTVGPLELSDFMNLAGYHMKFESASVNGTLTIANPTLKLNRLSGKENININGITLGGFSVRQFNRIVNQSIDSISGIQKLIKVIQVKAVIRQLKVQIDKIQNNQHDYSQTSKLGNFHTVVLAKDGLVTIPICTLNGSDLQGICGGYINFKTNTLHYLVLGQMLPSEKPQVINYIYLPYRIYGNLKNVKNEIDWQYTTRQLIEYYNNDNPQFVKLLDMNPDIHILIKSEKSSGK